MGWRGEARGAAGRGSDATRVSRGAGRQAGRQRLTAGGPHAYPPVGSHPNSWLGCAWETGAPEVGRAVGNHGPLPCPEQGQGGGWGRQVGG